MRLNEQETAQAGSVDAPHRVLLIIWVAMLFSIATLFLVANLIPPGSTINQDNRVVMFALIALGTLMVFASLVVKQKMLGKAVEQQRPELVQSAHIIAWAMSEVAGMLGLLLHLTFAERYYYLLFIIALSGMLLNLPRRQHLLDASSRREI